MGEEQTASRGGVPDVSVVIPTTGRPTLAAAVRSALDQTVAVRRVVVAVDGPVTLVGALPRDARVCVLSSSAFGTGGNAARVAGMSRVQDGLVALLDDDDVWHPRKLEIQLRRYAAARAATGRPVVVACRMREVDPTGARGQVVPERLLEPGERIGHFLFRRSRVRRSGGVLNSSMLLFDADLARRIPFDTSLPRHQDWDWLLRVDAAGAAHFTMVEEVLVDYLVNRVGSSTSSGPGWRSSERWVRRSSAWLAPQEQAEVLLSVTAPIAMKHGEWAAAARLVWSGLRLGPAPASVVFSLAHVPLLAWRRATRTTRAGAHRSTTPTHPGARTP